MHKRLETSVEEYLHEVTKQLGSLPAERWEEELREMRQHLHEAVANSRKQGLSEKQAVTAALTRYGTPKEAAESAIWAWQRDVQKHERIMGCWQFSYILLVAVLQPAGFGVLFWCWFLGFTGSLTIWLRLPRKYQPAWMYRLRVKD